MKKLVIGILLLTSFTAKSQNCPGNFIANGDFESTVPSNTFDNISEATPWMDIWQNIFGTGEVYTSNGSFWFLADPVPASGNYAGFWLSNFTGGEREGIMTQLATSIPAGNTSYDLTFDLAVASGTVNAEMAIYGTYNPLSLPSTVVTDMWSHNPTNLNLFGAGNTVLLGTVTVTGPADGSKQSILVNFCSGMAGFPTNGITHLFLTRSETINGGKKYVGVDDFCLIESETICSASMEIPSSEYEVLESPCAAFEVPVFCEGDIRIITNNCPIENYMLSIWEYDPANCTQGALAYTTSIQSAPVPGSFDIASLFTPTPGTVYWVEWAIQQNTCMPWDFDYALFKIEEDCCNHEEGLELQAWIDDNIIGYQTVTSQTYGWSSDVAIICDESRVYDFATNFPCADVWNITNSSFNTNTWSDIATLYYDSGTGALPANISIAAFAGGSMQIAPSAVNHLHIAIASPYQEIDILWIPSCNPDIELDDFNKGRSQESTEMIGMTNIGLSIFPNPTKESITVQLEESLSGFVSLYSMDGKELLTTDFDNQREIGIDLSEFPSGIYFVNVKTNGQVITRKVIKE